MAKRPMLVLALGLAGASAMATALGPRTLGIVWLAAGLGLLWAGRGRPSFPRLWIVPGWVLLGIIGLRALPVETQPIATGQFNGRWHGSGRALGELAGHPIPVQLPMGFARDGDRLALHASALRIQNASPPDEPTTDHSWMVEPAQIRRTQSAFSTVFQTPQWILELRERIARRLQDLESDRNRGLAQALLLGKSEAVDPGLKDRFTRTGTRHLLALSGLHVGLMWWLFMRPICQGLAGMMSFRVLDWGLPLGVQARLPAILQVIALAFFLPILGGGTPALRASLALGMADCARQVISAPGAPPGAGRRVDPLSIWSLALCLELLSRPESVTSVSLQLSYGATLGLIVFWAPWHALCVAQGPRILPAFLWESNS
ncbi:MAG: ComEC/Rec2 family competence protein, partial [Planctomycetota bacterium]|nr:ComEC/Rec2 family competence protein [Planctomycetota bacterium]